MLAASTLFARDHISDIEFFGYKGIDLETVRKALPVKPGDPLQPQIEKQIRDAVKRVTGRDATDVKNVCCDKQGDTFIYIGLAGASSRVFARNQEPTAKLQVSAELDALFQRMNEATFAAVRNGNTAEEQPSPGYRLLKDPRAREAILAVRQYALQHGDDLYRVLESSADSKQRAIAADTLGFVSRSPRQIAALVRASRDADDEVRNNATRALFEIAQSGADAASQIPPDSFIDMLWSAVWSDRNKANMLVFALSTSRDPQLLSRLRAEAFDPLVEIARWDADHAIGARIILGRIAGIPDSELIKLVYEDPSKIPGIVPAPAVPKP